MSDRLRPIGDAGPGNGTPLVVGVTSHRNLVPAEIDGLRRRVRALFAHLRERFDDLPLVVLSALAEGGDRLVAEEALACGARLHAVLPLPEELYIQDFVSPESREQFFELQSRATVLSMPLLERGSGSAIASPGTQRDAQYAAAGIFIASHCHLLLAIWDGRSSQLHGGTAQVVRYHLEGILPGTIERRRVARPLLDRGDESLLCHLACSRDIGSEGIQPPASPHRPLDMRWVSQQHDQPFDQGIPDEYACMFQRMVEFNRDLMRYALSMGDLPLRHDGPGSGHIERLFRAADWLAIHFQKRVLLAMRGIHVLAALMGIAFVAYSDLPGHLGNQPVMIDLFIAFFLSGFVLDRVARHRDWHRKYIDYRALAEGLRVQLHWHTAGIVGAESVAFAHDNFLQKQDVELGWIRNVMRAAGLDPGTSFAPDRVRAEIDRAIAEWIGTPDGGGQMGYYRHKCAERSRAVSTARRMGNMCLWAGIGIGVVLAIFHRTIDNDISTYLVAAIGVLAIAAAARESYAYRKADRELIKQYRFMLHLFESASAALEASSDTRSRREILQELGDAALAEHAEWALMHRERPLEHGRL